MYSTPCVLFLLAYIHIRRLNPWDRCVGEAPLPGLVAPCLSRQGWWAAGWWVAVLSSWWVGLSLLSSLLSWSFIPSSFFAFSGRPHLSSFFIFSFFIIFCRSYGSCWSNERSFNPQFLAKPSASLWGTLNGLELELLIWPEVK